MAVTNLHHLTGHDLWKAAPRGMIGLRLSPDSRSLTAAEILALPL
jgi:hypothetical protein